LSFSFREFSVTLAKSAKYHGKVGVLTLLSGAMQIHGRFGIEPLAEGTIEGLRQFLVANLGPQAAYDLLQSAADAVGDEIFQSSQS
jgi:hypothetical protein